MIVLCPSCDRSYKSEDYPPGASLACVCGTLVSLSSSQEALIPPRGEDAFAEALFSALEILPSSSSPIALSPSPAFSILPPSEAFPSPPPPSTSSASSSVSLSNPPLHRAEKTDDDPLEQTFAGPPLGSEILEDDEDLEDPEQTRGESTSVTANPFFLAEKEEKTGIAPLPSPPPEPPSFPSSDPSATVEFPSPSEEDDEPPPTRADLQTPPSLRPALPKSPSLSAPPSRPSSPSLAPYPPTPAYVSPSLLPPTAYPSAHSPASPSSPAVYSSPSFPPHAPLPVSVSQTRLPAAPSPVSLSSSHGRLPVVHPPPLSLQESSDPLPPLDSSEMQPLHTEGRAVLAFVLSFFVLLGPIALWLGISAVSRIKEQREILRGLPLAWFSVFLGLLESLAVGGFLAALFLFPQSPFSLSVARVLGFVPSHEMTFFTPADRAQNATLTQDRAEELLRRSLGAGEQQEPWQDLSLFQAPQSHHALLRWYHTEHRRNQLSLLLYSNSQRWYLESLSLPSPYESRFSLPGPTTLSASIAKGLIERFWKGRGGFSHVSAHDLYVVQKEGETKAYAFWKLVKTPPGKPQKTWFLRSLFHRSNQSRWLISRYALRTKHTERGDCSLSGPPLLTSDLAGQLLQQCVSDKEANDDFLPRLLVQAPSSRTATVFWQKSRRSSPPFRSLFRYTTDGRWILAFSQPSPKADLLSASAGSALLSEETAKTLLKPLLQREAQPPKLLHLHVFQRSASLPEAILRYTPSPRSKKIPTFHIKKPPTFQSKVFRSTEGQWFLSNVEPSFDGRFSKEDTPHLSSETASFLLREFWKEDETFAGSRVGHLYIFQEAQNNEAWAHWELLRHDQKTRMRSRFFFSNARRWVLAEYDAGHGVHAAFSGETSPLLSPDTARSLLSSFLIAHHKENKDKKDKEPPPRILDLYVHQEPRAATAHAVWLFQRQNQIISRRSLFHRSNQGRWYLSLEVAPLSPSLSF